MTPNVALLDNVQRFVGELDQIESVFSRCRGDATVDGFSFPYAPTEEGCLFAMWDAWTRFLRSLVVTSCSGAVISLGGNVYVAPTPMNEAQVLAYLVANRKGRNFGIVNGEPKWNNPGALADIVDALKMPNQSTVVSAVTATSISLGPIVVPTPLEEIRLARNFAAHKNPTTLADIAAFAPGGFVSLSWHLRSPRSGVEAFSEWKECLTTLAESAAQ